MTISDANPVDPASPDPPLEQQPGAMQIQLQRTLPNGGVVEFEYAPAGWAAKDGSPRKRDWRAYWYTPPAFSKRFQLTSVTTICEAIIPKRELAPWAEREGIFGVLEAIQQRGLPPETSGPAAVKYVRANRLGADAQRDRAAERGLNVHSVLEDFLRTGRVPNPRNHVEQHRPFIQGLARWLVATRPEPLEVELLTADPDYGYAGRIDLVARIGQRITLVDLKTQRNGAIYEGAHIQTALYRQAEEKLGTYRFDDVCLVVVDGTGRYRPMDLLANDTVATAALRFHSVLKPLYTACRQGNDIQRRALREVTETAQPSL